MACNHRDFIMASYFSTYSRVEQPAKWSAMTKFGDPDIKTSECVAYSQVQPPLTDGVQDATYEIIGQVIQSQ